ncbi:hypothetical protein [Arthrobacter nitrophenolicus]|uniref:Uncharacterized protein n=1 Tax=Arthrobacter nitrophenolicus TaxID=683150 RepID=A0A4R5XT55_9MICC|nr:hypothetical protein [Arthrobacter nitrophenolicus]TDL33977.1 hypothetical protein E2R57_15795 [Arthrobacter nitrophenolicus]
MPWNAVVGGAAQLETLFTSAAAMTGLSTGGLVMVPGPLRGRSWRRSSVNNSHDRGKEQRSRRPGILLRSHFLLGYDLPGTGMAPDQVTAEVHEALGPNPLQHAYDQLTFLSRILPPLYVAENGA